MIGALENSVTVEAYLQDIYIDGKPLCSAKYRKHSAHKIKVNGKAVFGYDIDVNFTSVKDPVKLSYTPLKIDKPAGSNPVCKMFNLENIPYKSKYIVKDGDIVLVLKVNKHAPCIAADYTVYGNTFNKLCCYPGVELPRIENFEPIALKCGNVKFQFDTVQEYNNYRIMHKQLEIIDKTFKKNINDIRGLLNAGFYSVVGMQICIFTCAFLILYWV